MDPPTPRTSKIRPRRPAGQAGEPQGVPLLWLLLGLFALRVAGQLPVMLWQPPWLPPPGQWYSGLIAYPYLLGFQLLFLFLMVSMIRGLEGTGPFGPPSARLATLCIAASAPYYGFMVYRWVFRVLLDPQRAWYDTLIPIVFHCVLATFLLVYGLAGKRRAEQP